jgi:hypothetical protein
MNKPTKPMKAAGPVRVLTWNDLRERGIHFHSNHLRKLWMSDRFPKPVYLSPRRLVWREADIDAWLTERTTR